MDVIYPELPRLPPWEVWEGRVGIDPQVGDRGFKRGVRFEGAGAALTRCSPGLDLLDHPQPEPDFVEIDTRQMNPERSRHLREPQKKPARPKELGDEPIFEGICGDDVGDRGVVTNARIEQTLRPQWHMRRCLAPMLFDE